MKEILVESMISNTTKQGRVNVFWSEGREPVQLSCNEARHLALNLLRAADSGESDAAVFRFLTQNGDDGKAAQLIAAIRRERKYDDFQLIPEGNPQ